MLIRQDAIVELPHELLKEFFLKSIQDAPASVLSLRCVNRLFHEVIGNFLLADFGMLFGDYQRPKIKYACLSSFSGAFFKMLQAESFRKQKMSMVGGVNLKGVSVENDVLFLPESMDHFIIAAVNARAYEDLHALCEEITLSYCNTISLRRVVEAIYLQAAMNYNELEMIRLKSFILFESNAEIGYVCCESGVAEYVRKPLSCHAHRFGNQPLAQALERLERSSPQLAPPA